MNPFYLEGDFNGDGAMDVAILVKNARAGSSGLRSFMAKLKR